MHRWCVCLSIRMVRRLWNGRLWRNADIRQIARVGYGGNNRRRTGLIAAIAHGVVSVFEGQADEVPQIARAQPVLGAEGADKPLENGKGRLPLKQLAQNIAFNACISSTRQLHMTKQTDTGFNEHRPGNGAAMDDPGEVRPNESIERRRVCEVGHIELDRLVYGSYATRRKRRSSINCQHFDDPPANEAGCPGHENGPFIAHVAPPCRVELESACHRHLPECDALHCDPDGSRFVAKCLASLL